MELTLMVLLPNLIFSIVWADKLNKIKIRRNSQDILIVKSLRGYWLLIQALELNIMPHSEIFLQSLD